MKVGRGMARSLSLTAALVAAPLTMVATAPSAAALPPPVKCPITGPFSPNISGQPRTLVHPGVNVWRLSNGIALQSASSVAVVDVGPDSVRPPVVTGDARTVLGPNGHFLRIVFGPGGGKVTIPGFVGCVLRVTVTSSSGLFVGRASRPVGTSITISRH